MSEKIANAGLADNAYEMVGRFERHKRKLKLLIMGSLLPAFLCSAMSAYTFVVYFHQKGGLYDIRIAAIALLALMGIILLGVAAQKTIALKKIKSKFNQFEMLEETIYSEVLKNRLD